MKTHISIFIAAFILSGCTHVSVSNPSLLNKPEMKVEIPKDERIAFPLHVDADMTCSSKTSGNLIRTSCSNRKRLNIVTDAFNELGLEPYVSKDQFKGPEMSVKHDQLNSLVSTFTKFLNIITLGILPEYNYNKYTVSYNNKESNIHVSESVKVSTTKSWVSLFIPNPKGLNKGELNELAETNLIRDVLDKAKVGK